MLETTRTSRPDVATVNPSTPIRDRVMSGLILANTMMRTNLPEDVGMEVTVEAGRRASIVFRSFDTRHLDEVRSFASQVSATKFRLVRDAMGTYGSPNLHGRYGFANWHGTYADTTIHVVALTRPGQIVNGRIVTDA